MLEYEEAVARILAAVPPVTSEAVALDNAHGRVLSAPVVSPIDLPGFDNSAMDGFAVRAADVAPARRESPVRLRVAGKVAAGETVSGEVAAGSCVRLFSGSPLPGGAGGGGVQEDERAEPDENVLTL